MTHTKRFGAILGAIFIAIVGLLVAPGTGQAAVTNTETRCTVQMPSGSGWTECQKVVYTDYGSTVDINWMEFYVKGARPSGNPGYRIYDFWLYCYNNSGTKVYRIDYRNKEVKVGEDSWSWSVVPQNMNCKEADVRFGGIGIKDNVGYMDDFGDGFSQLPVD